MVSCVHTIGPLQHANHRAGARCKCASRVDHSCRVAHVGHLLVRGIWLGSIVADLHGPSAATHDPVLMPTLRNLDFRPAKYGGGGFDQPKDNPGTWVERRRHILLIHGFNSTGVGAEASYDAFSSHI